MQNFTIISNIFVKRNYLATSDITFSEIYKTMSEYMVDNSYLPQLLQKRSERFEEIINFVKSLDIKYEPYVTINNNEPCFDEKKWIFLWIHIINKIMPNANVKLQEYTPINI